MNIDCADAGIYVDAAVWRFAAPTGPRDDLAIVDRRWIFSGVKRNAARCSGRVPKPSLAGWDFLARQLRYSPSERAALQSANLSGRRKLRTDIRAVNLIEPL